MQSTITTEFEFNAGHILPNSKKCDGLHGHDYHVQLVFRAGNDNEIAMLQKYDFDPVQHWVESTLNGVFIAQSEDEAQIASDAAYHMTARAGGVPTPQRVVILGQPATPENIAAMILEQWLPEYPLLESVVVQQDAKTAGAVSVDYDDYAAADEFLTARGDSFPWQELLNNNDFVDPSDILKRDDPFTAMGIDPAAGDWGSVKNGHVIGYIDDDENLVEFSNLKDAPPAFVDNDGNIINPDDMGRVDLDSTRRIDYDDDEWSEQ